MTNMQQKLKIADETTSSKVEQTSIVSMPLEELTSDVKTTEKTTLTTDVALPPAPATFITTENTPSFKSSTATESTAVTSTETVSTSIATSTSTATTTASTTKTSTTSTTTTTTTTVK